jgi:hypothetical protein
VTAAGLFIVWWVLIGLAVYGGLAYEDACSQR